MNPLYPPVDDETWIVMSSHGRPNLTVRRHSNGASALYDLATQVGESSPSVWKWESHHRIGRLDIVEVEFGTKRKGRHPFWAFACRVSELICWDEHEAIHRNWRRRVDKKFEEQVP